MSRENLQISDSIRVEEKGLGAAKKIETFRALSPIAGLESALEFDLSVERLSKEPVLSRDGEIIPFAYRANEYGDVDVHVTLAEGNLWAGIKKLKKAADKNDTFTR